MVIDADAPCDKHVSCLGVSTEDFKSSCLLVGQFLLRVFTPCGRHYGVWGEIIFDFNFPEVSFKAAVEEARTWHKA